MSIYAFRSRVKFLTRRCSRMASRRHSMPGNALSGISYDPTLTTTRQKKRSWATFSLEIEQPASDILEPHLDDDTAVPLTTHIQVFEALERVYGMPSKEYLYQGQFERLEQGNTDFNAFIAEFYRLAAPLRRDENSLLNSFRRKLSPTMQRHVIGRQNESLEDLIEFCRRVDDDLKIQRQSRRNAAYIPFSHTSKRTAFPFSRSLLASVRKTTAQPLPLPAAARTVTPATSSEPSSTGTPQRPRKRDFLPYRFLFNWQAARTYDYRLSFKDGKPDS